jgi:hypothetical protein
MQLDDLFQNEVLSSQIPFDDFSFLQNLIPSTGEPLHRPLIISPLAYLPNEEGCHEQDSTPRCEPTPVSTYSPGPGGDKISGLDSLRYESGREGLGSHIPPGLFISLDAVKNGFIGKHFLCFYHIAKH